MAFKTEFWLTSLTCRQRVRLLHPCCWAFGFRCQEGRCSLNASTRQQCFDWWRTSLCTYLLVTPSPYTKPNWNETLPSYIVWNKIKSLLPYVAPDVGYGVLVSHGICNGHVRLSPVLHMFMTFSLHVNTSLYYYYFLGHQNCRGMLAGHGLVRMASFVWQRQHLLIWSDEVLNGSWNTYIHEYTMPRQSSQ